MVFCSSFNVALQVELKYFLVTENKQVMMQNHIKITPNTLEAQTIETENVWVLLDL